MSGLAVALSTWSLATVIALFQSAPAVSANAAATNVAKKSPEANSSETVTFPAKRNRSTVSGFRMEGSPEVEVVFGDVNHYRARIDRFFILEKDMDATRRTFSRHVQAALATLAKGKQRSCPSDLVAPYYYQAHQAADQYRRLGVDFEVTQTAILRLHKFGETDGLTPDYRWKVNKVRGAYRATLRDYREMQIALIDQLEPELRHRGCKQETLLEKGKLAPALPLELVAAATPKPPEKKSWRKRDPIEATHAKTVTFFINNKSCKDPLTVYLDGRSLGDVEAKGKSAFQSVAGNHIICLIPKNTTAECGDAGTVRNAYVHDGWAMTLHCAE